MNARLSRTLLVALAVLALAGAGIAANVVLLAYADSTNDPVGKLTPRADIRQPASPALTKTTRRDQRDTDVAERDD